MSLESAIEALIRAVEQNTEALKTAAAQGGAEKPAAEKPAAEKPAAEKPADKKPAAKKPAAKKPAAEKPAAEKPADKKPADKKPADKKPADKKPAAKTPAEIDLRPDIDINGLRKIAGAYMAAEDPDARELAKSNVRAAFDHLGVKVLTDLAEQAQMTSLAAYIDTWVANGGAQIDFEAIDSRVADALGSPDEDEDSLLG